MQAITTLALIFSVSLGVATAQDFTDSLSDDGARLAPSAPVSSVYRIAMQLDTDLWTFSALEQVDYTNREEVTLDHLVFRVLPNADFMLEGKNGESRNLVFQWIRVNGIDVAAVDESTVLTVPLATPLHPGESVQVRMLFRGKLPHIEDGTDMQKMAVEQIMQLFSPEGTHGSSLGNFGIFGTTGRIGSMALWYPVVAMFDEQGWDEGSPEEMGDFSYFDAADIQVTVRAPKNVRIIGGGIVTSERLHDDQQVVTLTAGRARELTLQISRDYRRASGEVEGVRVNSWSLAEHTGTGMTVLSQAMKAVQIYTEEFGPYPYRELDVVEAPLLNGVAGVEFPGLCTIASMFYAPNAGTADASDPMAAMMGGSYMKDTLEFVVAHEVAHQWWNACVGSDSRGHPFIDEALANYSAIVYFEKAHGAESARKALDTQVKLNYHLSRMMDKPDLPVDLPSSAFADPIQYVATVYGKGALFYLALRELIGHEPFTRAIQGYYRQHYLGVAHPEGLPDACKQVAPAKAEAIDALCERWLRGSHGDEDIGKLGMGQMLKMSVDMLDLESMDLGENEDLKPMLNMLGDLLDLLEENR